MVLVRCLRCYCCGDSAKSFSVPVLILQLKSNLQDLKKGGDSNDTYLDKIKVASDALETLGVFLDDEDDIVTVL